MAKRHGGATYSALDKMYGRLTSARKQSRGHASWRQKTAACDVPTTDGSKGRRFPCTTTYVQTKTGRKAIVRTTRSAQFAMPKALRSIGHLRGVPGVVSPRKRKSSGGKRRKSSGGKRRKSGGKRR